MKLYLAYNARPERECIFVLKQNLMGAFNKNYRVHFRLLPVQILGPITGVNQITGGGGASNKRGGRFLVLATTRCFTAQGGDKIRRCFTFSDLSYSRAREVPDAVLHSTVKAR